MFQPKLCGRCSESVESDLHSWVICKYCKTDGGRAVSTCNNPEHDEWVECVTCYGIGWVRVRLCTGAMRPLHLMGWVGR